MIARLQRILCFSLLALAMTWCLGVWHWSPALAIAGLVLPVLGYGAVLAGQFVLLASQPSEDVERPTAVQWLAAWWRELVCGLQVFAWRQPFRSDDVPDALESTRQRSGVIFVHGLMCNRGFWSPWMDQAQAMGLPCMAVNLEPVLGAIDRYVPTLEAAVARMQAASGRPPVLICHSMGGLAARAWLRSAGARGHVAHVITIGSPHAGTWMARFGQGLNSVQMRLSSRWLQDLAQGETEQDCAQFTCWYSNCDNIVFPVLTATLARADNRFVPGQPHIGLAFHPRVMRESLAIVAALR